MAQSNSSNTGQMWANILTKPLQGSKFCLFRAFLMNCPENYTEEPPFVPRPTLQPISTNLQTKPQISKITPLRQECVWAKPTTCSKRNPSTNNSQDRELSKQNPFTNNSQDRELISVPYNTTEKNMSAGMTPFFHVVPHQPSNLLAWIL
jgi:hypothetical protein